MNKIDISKCPYGCKNDNYCSLYEDDCYDYMDCDYRQLQQYKHALDEIEEYLNQYVMLGKLNIKYLLQLIKQAKEVKGNERN